jgi:hypothetical protein
VPVSPYVGSPQQYALPAAVSAQVWCCPALIFEKIANPALFAVIVAIALAVTPSEVAEIVVLPGVSAVTTPLLDTDATAVFDELHVNVFPESAVPVEESAVTVSVAG